MKLKLKNKILEIKAKECKGIMKAIGLMFSRQENASALRFKFKKPVKMAIHSLFCPEFLAIWLKNKQVIDYEFVKTTRFLIKPGSEFDCLVEIPLNKSYENITRYFI
jgi:hypothetical protein